MNDFTATIQIPAIGLENLMLEELKDAVVDIFNRAVTKIYKRVGNLVRDAILNSPEVKLWQRYFVGQIGIVDIGGTINAIAKTIADNVTVETFEAGLGNVTVLVRLDINILPNEYNDILALPEASFVSENGFIVDWLEWLLLGQHVIIGYQYFGATGFKNKIARWSRTGQGIMVKSPDAEWEVPPQIAGTEEDNFLTRAFESSNFINEFQNMLQQELLREAL